MKKPFTIAANWKMNLSFNESVEYATKNRDNFISLAQKKDLTLILCPSFDSLYPLNKMFTSTAVNIGAQDCSEFRKGSFTGQVSVESIHALGCTHAIIGHSERRKYNHENNKEIAKKCDQLLDLSLSPILCIGEILEEYEAGNTLKVLEDQLKPLKEIIEKHSPLELSHPMCIAYEPVWSIGTGKTANNNHIEKAFSYISQWAQTIDKRDKFQLLYGGSVNEKTIQTLCNIKELNGFLIGGASLDFQIFEKIIDCVLETP